MNNEKKNIMDPLSAGIGAIGGVIDSVASIFTKKAERKAQQRENQLAREHTEEMYNKYESPQAQAAQLRAAGLNPQGAVTPNSVGTASTSALPAGGSHTNFAGAIQQGLQFGMAKQDIAIKKDQEEGLELDNQNKLLENQILAVKAGNIDEYVRLDIESRELANHGKKLSNEEKEVAIQEAKLRYQQQREAYEQGINPEVDKHNESVATTNNLNASAAESRQNIEESKSRIDVNKTTAAVNRALENNYTVQTSLDQIKLKYADRQEDLKTSLLTIEKRVRALYDEKSAEAKLRNIYADTLNKEVSVEKVAWDIYEMVDTYEIRKAMLELGFKEDAVNQLLRTISYQTAKDWRSLFDADLWTEPGDWTQEYNPLQVIANCLGDFLHHNLSLGGSAEVPSSGRGFKFKGFM